MKILLYKIELNRYLITEACPAPPAEPECKDLIATKKCKKRKNKGKCNKPWNQQKCAKTCGAC